MGGLMKSLFVPSKDPKSPKIKLPEAAAAAPAEDPKNRQGRGLNKLNLRSMYNTGKQTLGASA